MPLSKSQVNPALITAANIRNVTRFVPRLRNIRASQVFNKYKRVGNTITIPAEIHKPLVRELMRVLADNNFVQPFNWVRWQPEAVRFFGGTRSVANANLETCVKLLTLHVRKDRFCSGHFGAMLVRGHIQRILNRVACISKIPGGERR
jgi:hypothetical protein